MLIGCSWPQLSAGSKLAGAGQGSRDAEDLASVGHLHLGEGETVVETEFWAKGVWVHLAAGMPCFQFGVRATQRGPIRRAIRDSREDWGD